MKAKFTATNPGSIEMTMTLTMTVDDWVKVQEALHKSKEPTHFGALAPIVSAVYDMVVQANRNFRPETPEGSS